MLCTSTLVTRSILRKSSLSNTTRTAPTGGPQKERIGTSQGTVSRSRPRLIGARCCYHYHIITPFCFMTRNTQELSDIYLECPRSLALYAKTMQYMQKCWSDVRLRIKSFLFAVSQFASLPPSANT